jgi:hypothetical protein
MSSRARGILAKLPADRANASASFRATLSTSAGLKALYQTLADDQQFPKLLLPKIP